MEKKDTILVKGPVGVSLWQRKKDHKTIFIVGEYHVFEACEKSTIDALDFLAYLTSLFPETGETDVFLELRVDLFKEGKKFGLLRKADAEGTPIYETNRFAEANNCFAHHWGIGKQSNKEPPHDSKWCPQKMRVHAIDLRPWRATVPTQPLAYSPFVIRKLQHTEKIFEQEAGWMTKTIQKQISKLKDKTDQKILTYQLQELQRNRPGQRKTLESLRIEVRNIWFQLQQLDQKIKGFEHARKDVPLALLRSWESARQTIDEEITSYISLLLGFNSPWIDLYATARMLKPYVHRAILLCGNYHRRMIDLLLPKLGFTLVYQKNNDRSCVNSPTSVF